MAELFSSQQLKAQKKTDYTAEDIEVLEGLEPVRHRPGMYIGGTDQKALHHLVAEILDNAMDEVVAGYANKIMITLNHDNSITISDNGRGIPVDPHPKYPEKSALEVILTTLHSGGKFSSNAYETSGGLHGVGISVVNALSERFEVIVWRDGFEYKQGYSKGHLVSPLESKESTTRAKGTEVTFYPDPEIFGDLMFHELDLYKMVKSKAYLQKGVKIHWINKKNNIEQVPEKEVFFFPNGIQDFLIQDQGEVDVNNIFSDQVSFGEASLGKVEWALQWVDSMKAEDDFSVLSFCNTIPTPLGGTHEIGFRSALLKSIKEIGERFNKKSTQITQDDIDVSIRSVLSCFIPQPQFQGQTKEKLVSQNVSRLVENAVKNRLDHWFVEHPSNAEKIINYLIERSEDRLRRRQEKEVARASATKRLRLPGKLSDCSKTNPAECELFIVEGDSAGGTAKQARSRQTQAVLPLRGKILNVATATFDKLKSNQQIADLILALGCGVGKSCDLSKLRYHKVIIMTDADVDGAHIAALLITFFYRELKPLLKNGHIYLAKPPLYRLSAGDQIVYAQNDAEKDSILQKTFKKYKKVDISRFKGLGEMPMQQLRSTTMDVNKRFLEKIIIDDDAQLEDFVEQLMGKNAQSRFVFITENAQFVKNVDV